MSLELNAVGAKKCGTASFREGGVGREGGEDWEGWEGWEGQEGQEGQDARARARGDKDAFDDWEEEGDGETEGDGNGVTVVGFGDCAPGVSRSYRTVGSSLPCRFSSARLSSSAVSSSFPSPGRLQVLPEPAPTSSRDVAPAPSRVSTCSHCWP